jgi:aspartate aminotransferase
MTGWRLGYLAAELHIGDSVSNLQDHSNSNASSISQKAGLAELSMDEKFFDGVKKKFQERRDYIVSRLDKMNKKISYYKPQGAFYIFCNIKKTKLDSFVFAKRLLEDAHVALIPGEPFGCNDYVRISFATSMEKIEKGLDRIEKWIAKI